MTKDIQHPLGENEAELEPAAPASHSASDPARLLVTLSLAQAMKGLGQLSGIVLIVPWDAAWCGAVLEAWDDIRETRAAHPAAFFPNLSIGRCTGAGVQWTASQSRDGLRKATSPPLPVRHSGGSR